MKEALGGKKSGRGKYVEKGAEKLRCLAKGKKLAIDFDRVTLQTMRDNHGPWIRDLGALARD